MWIQGSLPGDRLDRLGALHFAEHVRSGQTASGASRPSAKHIGQTSATPSGSLPNISKRTFVMLITFKTSAAPDVMMLDNLAEYLLGIVGKSLSERGVITHDELPSAIEKLEAAIHTDKRERAEHDGHFHEGEDGHEPHEIPIGLAQRAYPFLDMLRLAQKENTDILWGV
jgi:hypothetical protein